MKNKLKVTKFLLAFVCVLALGFAVLFSGGKPVSADETTGSEIPAGALVLDEVNVPDANFRTWIKENVSGASDDVLTVEELFDVTKIEVNNQGIFDLTGIEYFTSLTSLNCSNNSLTSVDISALTALTVFSCHSNFLTSLDLSHNSRQ